MMADAKTKALTTSP